MIGNIYKKNEEKYLLLLKISNNIWFSWKISDTPILINNTISMVVAPNTSYFLHKVIGPVKIDKESILVDTISDPLEVTLSILIDEHIINWAKITLHNWEIQGVPEEIGEDGKDNLKNYLAWIFGHEKELKRASDSPLGGERVESIQGEAQ